MSKQQEALRLALEALEKITRHFGFKRLGESRLTDTQARGDAHEAITALREALAERPAQQEPVAVVSGYYGGQCVILPIDPARIYNSNTFLYTAPPPCQTCEALARTVMLDQTSHDAQRKPLTDEQIAEMMRQTWGCASIAPRHAPAFARAIETAHGIGEKK